MNGWIVFSNDNLSGEYRTLTRLQVWYDEEGWIWTDEELLNILKFSKNWKHRPTHIQKAILIANSVKLIGQKIELGEDYVMGS